MRLTTQKKYATNKKLPYTRHSKLMVMLMHIINACVWTDKKEIKEGKFIE